MFEVRPILSSLSRHKSSTLLVVLQVAITFAVVINSISIIKQRIELMERKSGLVEEQLFTLNINAFGKNYNIEQNIRADIELLRKTPGVIDAVAINQIPLSGSGDSGMVASSQENFDQFVNFGAGFFFADSHTLNTMGVKLVAGRNFTEDEVVYSAGRPDINVTLITQSLADKVFPNENALGKQLFLGGTDQLTIIGIIEKLSGPWVHNPIFEDNMISPYVRLTGFKRVLVRAKAEAMNELMGNVEKMLLERNDERVIFAVNSLGELRERSYRSDIAMSKILWSVVILLVLITALGIIGIVSFNVSQRVKQIGTRRALGARKIDILGYFLTENAIITSLGLISGIIITFALNIYLVNHFDMSPINWYFIPLGIALMFILGIISVWMPARKASNISPAIATQSI